MDYLMVFLLGVYVGAKLDRWVLLTKAYRLIAKDQPKACPHGHTNWDECPDCCH